ncbi:MAG TPA: PqqD family protein [Thermoanaerobaculia bacterium]|nr:PqqD family protein [Thermoanaerobaculia bacterium]
MSSSDLVPGTVVRHRPGILFRDLAGEAVLLDPQAGTYFGLNEVGTRVWNLFATGASLETVRAALLAGYDAPPERIWDDLLILVRDLLAHGLVEIAGET